MSKNILIIDPDRKARMDTCISLENEGYTVGICGRLFEALNVMRKKSFECVLMDVDLPDMKGYQAVQVIKQLYPDIKIIMTASNNTKRLESRVREQDVFYYYIKSFGIEELNQAVRILFDHSTDHSRAGANAEERRCRFLRAETMTYCGAYSIKKPIPLESMNASSPCITGNYHACSFYKDIFTDTLIEDIRGFHFKKELYYHRGHIWLRPEGGDIRMGVDDFSRRLLGSFTGVAMPLMGTALRRGEDAFVLRCGTRCARLPSPIDGKIVDVHDALFMDPGPLNDDPYGKGWLLSVHPSGEDPLKEAICGEKARRWFEEDTERLHRILEAEMGLTVTDGGEPIHDLHDRLDALQWNRLLRLFFIER